MTAVRKHAATLPSPIINIPSHHSHVTVPMTPTQPSIPAPTHLVSLMDRTSNHQFDSTDLQQIIGQRQIFLAEHNYTGWSEFADYQNIRYQPFVTEGNRHRQIFKSIIAADIPLFQHMSKLQAEHELHKEKAEQDVKLLKLQSLMAAQSASQHVQHAEEKLLRSKVEIEKQLQIKLEEKYKASQQVLLDQIADLTKDNQMSFPESFGCQLHDMKENYKEIPVPANSDEFSMIEAMMNANISFHSDRRVELVDNKFPSYFKG